MNTENLILRAQFQLLLSNPFFGVLLTHLNKVDATDDPAIRTMATDGRTLFYNSKFVGSLTKDELVFVLAHEVMHNALEHHIRRGSRDPKRWNMAGDYAINGELSACSVGKMPKAGLIDPAFTGLGAEEIYRLLESQGEGGGGAGGGAGDDPGGCGGTMDGCSQHDEPAKSALSAEMQTTVRQAAMAARAAAAGKLPAGMQRLLDQILAPRVDWRVVLRRFIDESSIRDFAWSRPNRRMLAHGYITPGSVSVGVSKIVIAVDTSGSIDGKILSDFAAEVNGAYQEGGVDKISVIYADAKVHRTDDFENGDPIVIKPVGGGGTDFRDTFRLIREKHQDARACIYLTDMHVSRFGDEPEMPVMWGVYGRTKDFSSLSPPFGECINISV